jgi:hypothetical protein
MTHNLHICLETATSLTYPPQLPVTEMSCEQYDPLFNCHCGIEIFSALERDYLVDNYVLSELPTTQSQEPVEVGA